MLAQAVVSLTQAQGTKFRLTVRVTNFDNSTAVTPATINLLNATSGNPLTGTTRVTNSTGFAEWSGTQGLQSGTYTLVVDRRGVQVLRMNITMNHDQTKELLVGVSNLTVDFIDGSGRPVEDVEATLARKEFRETSTTGESGNLVFVNEPFGNYTLEVSRQGVDLGTLLIDFKNSTASISRTFHVPSYSLTVNLQTSNGSPLPGSVQVEAYDWGTGKTVGIAGPTSPNRYTLTNVPGKCWLIAELDGHRIVESLLTLERNATLSLKSDYGYSLSIRIVDSSGVPVSGTNVKVYHGENLVAERDAGSDGETMLEDLFGGQYRVEAYYQGELRATDTVDVANSTSLELTLTNLSNIGGQEVDLQILSVVAPITGLLVAGVVTYLAWRFNRQRSEKT